MKLMKLKSAVIVAAVASVFSFSAQATTIFSDNFSEPGSYALFLAGLAIMGAIARRRRSNG